MPKILKHIVFLNFKNGTAQSEIENIIYEFISLKEKIPAIQSIEWGRNVSPEGKNQGFSHCFCLIFLNAEDRDLYLINKDHVMFGNLLEQFKDKVLVFDYYSGID